MVAQYLVFFWHPHGMPEDGCSIVDGADSRPEGEAPGGGLFSRRAASAYRARRYRPLVRSFGVSWVANGRAGNIDGHFIVWCGQNHPGALRCGKREVSPNLCRGRRKRRLHLIQIEAFERAQSTYDRAVARPKLAEELPAPR